MKSSIKVTVTRQALTEAQRQIVIERIKEAMVRLERSKNDSGVQV